MKTSMRSICIQVSFLKKDNSLDNQAQYIVYAKHNDYK